MKHAYFTSKTIQRQARRFLKRLPRKQSIAPIKGRPALLVLDMQEYFLVPESHAFVPSGQAIIPNVNSLIAGFLLGGNPVIATQHINHPEDAGMMAVWWHKLITPDNPFAGLSKLVDLTGVDVLVKHQYDAFFQTDLEARLRSENIHSLVICGVLTHLCCETTARSAFTRGFQVWFTVDATATYNSEFHLGTLRNLAHGFSVPVLTTDVLAAL